MNPRKTTFKNFKLLQELVANGINNYLQEFSVMGDRDGIFHGKKGLNRAKKLKEYFAKQPSNIDTLALLLAIFGKPNAGLFGWSPGRSSRLSGLIADQLIIGEWKHGHVLDRVETLTSFVFSAEALIDARDKYDNKRIIPAGAASFMYFDKTQGVRYLINKALNNEYKQFANDIRNAAKKTSAKLEDKSQQIDLTLLTDIPGEKAFTQGGALGALKNGSRSHKLPDETTRLIGMFLTRSDASKLVQTTKSALVDAQFEKQFIKKKM